MGGVVNIDVPTTMPLPPEQVLTGAVKYGLKDVLVLGWAENGEFYIASSNSDIGGLMLLVELAKNELVEQAIG